MSEFLTVKEVAEALGVNHGKVGNWIAAGELEAFDVSKAAAKKARWRIPRQALDRFLTSRNSLANKPAATLPATSQKTPRRQPYKRWV